MPEAAEAAFTRALERTERLGDKERRLETLCQAAAFYQRHGRPEALPTYQEALKCAKTSGARRHLVQILQGLASLEPEKAADYKAEADRVATELTQQAQKSRQLAVEAQGH